MTDAPAAATHEPPFTIAIDIGGTGLKADVLDKDGVAVAGRVRVPTTYPMPPRRVGPYTDEARGQAARGGPGVVWLPRHGPPGTRPQRTTLRPQKGPGTKTDPQLFAAWSDFDLAAALAKSIGKPCRVANDADVQGLAVVRGKGFEAVITLGTGFGTAFFMDGSLMPHVEFSHVEFRKGETFNEQIGEPARKKAGDERWNKRVRKAIAYLDALCFFDHLYIGGGNAHRVNRRDLGDVLERITVVDNSAGILGGIKLWDGQHVGVEGGPQ